MLLVMTLLSPRPKIESRSVSGWNAEWLDGDGSGSVSARLRRSRDSPTLFRPCYEDSAVTPTPLMAPGGRGDGADQQQDAHAREEIRERLH